MNKKLARYIVSAACALLPATAWADASGAAGILKLGAGSKAAALSDAFTAGSGDPAVMFYNPAGLAFEKGTSAMAGHALWFESVSYTSFAVNRRMGDYGALGFGLQMVNYGSMDSLDNTGTPDGSFSPKDMVALAGWGKTLADNWAAGVQAKYLSVTIDNSATAFLADIGAQYKREAFTAGLSVQNFGTKLKFNSESEAVPTQIRLGASYGWEKITAYGDIGAPSDAKTWIALGGEYKVFAEEKFRAALRAGYSTRAGDARNDKTFPLSFGLGIGMNAFGLDYAFVPYGDLGSTSHITIGYRWGNN